MIKKKVKGDKTEKNEETLVYKDADDDFDMQAADN